MITARFFIGEDPIEYSFDETASVNNAIDHLSMLYYEKKHVMPMAIFLSPDIYALMMNQNIRFHTQIQLGDPPASMFLTSVGTVMVKIVTEPNERFIYAGNEEGYQNALIDKWFEKIILEVEDET